MSHGQGRLRWALLSMRGCMVWGKCLGTIVFWFIFCLPGICGNASAALQPDEILVIANVRMKGSVSLARDYISKRGVPEEHLLSVSVSTEEDVSRGEYQRAILKPLREKLRNLEQRKSIRCLVTMYGMPLRVLAPPLTQGESMLIEQLTSRKGQLADPGIQNIWQDEKNLDALIGRVKRYSQIAALDSELSLARIPDYPLNNWLPNPHYLERPNSHHYTVEEIFLVSRLDGPNVSTVTRLTADALHAEKNGLSGNAYFDARYRDDNNDGKSPYQQFDRYIYAAAGQVEAHLPTIIEDTPRLFEQGEAKNAALYCGWYSLAKYVDSFEWERGSVGYHVASAECTTLRKKGSEVWCKKIIEHGAAATIGPVQEPFLHAFPRPDIFFRVLIEEKKSLVESYFFSLPHISWRMILIGDPLYTPFKGD